MTTNRSFPCGHENAADQRLCGVCGAARLKQCGACHASNQGDATYCSACGHRLESVAAAAAAESLREQDVVRWATDRRGRSAAPADDEAVVRWATDRRGRNPAPVDDEPDDDLIEQTDRRAQPLATAAVVALVIAFIGVVGYAALAKHTVFLERVPDKRDARVSAPATAPPDSSPAPDKRQAIVPSLPPPAPPAPEPQAKVEKSLPLSEPAADAQETKTADPITLPPRQMAAEPSDQTPRETVKQTDQTPREMVKQTNQTPRETVKQTDQTPRETVKQTDQTPREALKQTLTVAAADNAERPRAAASPVRTSEERMAAYLVDEFGSRKAAEKALSNAAWYDEGRSERQYWRRVAEAVTRRGGR